MKTGILTTVALICGFVYSMVIYADLSGKWAGTLNIPNGQSIPLTYVFKIDGEKLGGSVTSAQGELPITDGKTNGSEFVFIVNVNGSVIKNTGKYYAGGDTIGINADFGTTKLHAKLVRAQ